MKNISYVISGVLAICVGVLFYQVQSLKGGAGQSVEKTVKGEQVNTPEVQNVVNNLKLPDAKIAYVNIDTLNSKYLYITESEKVMKGRQQALEGTIQNLSQKFQQDYESAQQSAQAGIMPPAEIEAKKAQLQRQQQEIESKQMQLEALAMEMHEKTDKMKADIKVLLVNYYKDKYDFILTYSSSVPTILLANPALEITTQVIDMLNAEYKNKKSNLKK